MHAQIKVDRQVGKQVGRQAIRTAEGQAERNAARQGSKAGSRSWLVKKNRNTVVVVGHPNPPYSTVQ